jgi:hypothetical protein
LKDKIVKSFFLILICGLTLCSTDVSCLAGQASQTDWSSVVGKTKDAIVVIETDRGLGSGFLLRSNGILVTNKHVINDASQIRVTFASGEKYHKAFVLAEDEDRDIAILRIEGSALPSLSVANSSEAEIGSDVLLIGAPQGLSHTVSNGIISALRLLPNGTKVIQTTAAASPGSSGGPLITRDGRVIGMLTFAYKEGQNLNFAIPANYIQAMLETVETLSTTTPLHTLTRLQSTSTSIADTTPKEGNPAKAKLDGTLFVAWRTVNHRQYSSSEVFQGIVDEVLLFLKQNRLKLANDELRSTLQVENAISTYEVTQFARKAGASHVLVLTVDRPVSSWVKMRLQCITAEGTVLWEENAQNSSWLKSGAGGVKAAIKDFKASIGKRLSKSSLPLDNPASNK